MNRNAAPPQETTGRPQLTVVGLGPGDPGLVTMAAVVALRAARTVFVPRRANEERSLAGEIAATYVDTTRQQLVELPLVMGRDATAATAAWDTAAATMAEALRDAGSAVYALLGDPMLYGSFTPLGERLAATLPDLSIKFIAGVTSISAAAALIGEPLVMGAERLAILPGLHAAENDTLDRVASNFDTIAVLKADARLPAVLEAFAAGHPDARIWLAERIGQVGERVLHQSDELHGASPGYFSLALIKQQRADDQPRVAGGKVWIVGAGPGAPDLLTIRAQRVIAAADALVYADSLVMETVTHWAKPGALIVPTSGMHLDEILALMREVTSQGGVVARIHSGDPSLYGAINEQIAALKAAGIPYEIVPGVTVAFAAAARLGVELTIPEQTQTIILTRVSGRASPVPEAEALPTLAAHRASLAIYLAATKAHQVEAELLRGGYPPATPVAICYRVEWPDEQIVGCRLDELASTIRAMGWTRQTLILVSPTLAPPADAQSRLYDPAYVHRFRNRKQIQSRPARPVEPQHPAVSPPTVIAITKAGSQLAIGVARKLNGDAFVPERFVPGNDPAVHGYTGPVANVIHAAWARHADLVLVMATGIAVRAIGPLAADKQGDPAVVVCDDRGRAVISLLSGHLGGANRLAEAVAAITGGAPIITTASEVESIPALDLFAREHNWRLAAGAALTRAQAALVNGDPVALFDPLGLIESDVMLATVVPVVEPSQLSHSHFAATIVVDDAIPQTAWLASGAVFHPPTISAGIGCRRGTLLPAIEAAVQAACTTAGVAFAALGVVATHQLKADEPGLLAFAEKAGVPLRVYGDDEVRAVVPAVPWSTSAASERFDLPGVAEPCALLGAGSDRLLVPKQVTEGVTVALARLEVRDGQR